MTREVRLLFGPADGQRFQLPPDQTVIRAFDGQRAHVYEPNDAGDFEFVYSYPAEPFDWASFEREFAQYTGALPVRQTINPPRTPRRGTNVT
jgi:hypothetical protein